MIYFLIVSLIVFGVGLFFFYKIAKEIGAKEATLNTLNDSLKREEVKRNDYIAKTNRIIQELPPIKTTTTLNGPLASQVLSGKVYRLKIPKT